jgi:predicted membrane-bound dolichyl-phosphate-mannose-protein mannosyltransferase
LSRTAEISSVETKDAVAIATAQRRLSDYSATGVIAALALFVLLGFGLRLSGITAVGFAEDEINKLDAVRAYEQGDISPNAEHPMLMKSLIYLSMQAQQAWNARAENKLSDEAALRFPNLLFGALTAVPLFLLTSALFDRRTGLIAAALWAFGVNAITYNRIAKEDTLLVFFMLFGFYFYLRGKQTSGYDQQRKRRRYAWSGVAFGLMMASKYFPHYFGLNALYHYLFRVREREPGEPTGKVPPIYYILIAVAFLLANPAVLLPQTWQYLNAYTSEKLLTHTGYLMGDHLYKNNPSSTPFWGTPLYFYALFLAIKVPVPVLLAFLVGLVQCVRRWRQPGHGFLLLMFLLWIIPYSLFGAKWLRYTLSLMPFAYMIAAVGIVALIHWCVSLFKSTGASAPQRTTRIATAVALLIFIALPAWTAYSSGPHYAAYTNALGGGRVGYYFPHDEFYDDGLREAIRFVCERAPHSATIAHETPAAVRYYLAQCGRTDLQSRVLSAADFKLEDELKRPAYIIIQRGRTYFENQDKIKEARARLPLVYEVKVEGASAAEVYATRQGQ